MGIGLLRKTIGEKAMTAIWSQTFATPIQLGSPCAICSGLMTEVIVELGEHPLQLDVCKRCEFVWFDSQEFESIPLAPPSAQPRVLGEIDESAMAPEAREALAMIKLQEIEKQANTQDPMPDGDWKTFPALFGLPVEMDASEAKQIPWATYSVGALIAVVSIASFFDLKNIIDAWGLIPAEAWRHHGLTLLTSFFLHVGVIHLVGNLYFMIIFGGHVENYLGWRRWLGLLILAALAGDLCHIAADPNQAIPCVGASGGISALITFYALKFPYAQLGILFRWYLYFRWIRLPAWSAFLLWMIFQFWGAYQQVHGFTDVSAMAHLGGTAVGIAGWFLWRNMDAKPDRNLQATTA